MLCRHSILFYSNEKTMNYLAVFYSDFYPGLSKSSLQGIAFEIILESDAKLA